MIQRYAIVGALALGELCSAGMVHGQTRATPVTFTRDIAPILAEHCWSCHRPNGSAPFSLVTYEETRRRAALIADVTARRVMPPWKPEPGTGEFIGERRLTPRQIDLIRTWVEQGRAEGSVADLPAVPAWRDGWQLGRPDLELQLPESYLLSAGGPDVLRNFVIPIPTATRRYVRGMEFIAGASNVIHHATFRIDRTSASQQLDDDDPTPGYAPLFAPSARYPDGFFLAWTPGQLRPLSEDSTWPLDPGSSLVLQLHLRPTGKAETIRPSIGLYFTNTPPSRLPFMIRLGRQNIDIPPGEKQYVLEDSYTLPVDVELNEIQPHAHYLARRVEGLARMPDGETQSLIQINDWDFNWQDVYRLAQPLRLPRGTELRMRYVYDNSRENIRNPSPSPRRVVWGQNSADEMGDLWLQVYPSQPRDRTVLQADADAKMVREDLIGFTGLLGADPTSPLLHDAVASCYLQLGRVDEALTHLRESVRLDPKSAYGHYNLGTALLVRGDLTASLAALEEAARLKPEFAAAQNNIAGILWSRGERERAVARYRQVVAIEPNHALAHKNLADALHALGQREEALGYYEHAARQLPDDGAIRHGWGRALAATGRIQEALVQYRLAVRQQPDEPELLQELGWILAAHPDARIRALDEALRLAEQAAAITNRGNPRVMDLLATAYAADARYDDAVVAARTALSLAVTAGDSALAAEIQSRLRLYEAGQPFRFDFSGSPIKLDVR